MTLSKRFVNLDSVPGLRKYTQFMEIHDMDDGIELHQVWRHPWGGKLYAVTAIVGDEVYLTHTDSRGRVETLHFSKKDLIKAWKLHKRG